MEFFKEGHDLGFDMDDWSVLVDRFQDKPTIAGLYRKLLFAPPLPTDETEEEDFEDTFPSGRGSFVKVRVEGRFGRKVIFPKRELEFFIGDGILHGLPIGVDAALALARRGETTLVTILTPELLQPFFEVGQKYLDQGLSDDGVYYTFLVSLVDFKDVPSISEDEECSIEERLDISARLNQAASQLFEAGYFALAGKKFEMTRKFVDEDTGVFRFPKEHLEQQKVLLTAALIGLSQCFIKITEKKGSEIEGLDSSAAVTFAERALTLLPDSIHALLNMAGVYMVKNEPKKGLKYLRIADEQNLKTNWNWRGNEEDVKIQAMIALCQTMIEEQHKADVALQRRMFQGFFK